MNVRVNNLLIGLSQLLNIIIGDGDHDKMLCSWAWQNRANSKYANYFVWFVDNYLWPLKDWKDPGWTHCESCWYYERDRILNRAKLLEEDPSRFNIS